MSGENQYISPIIDAFLKRRQQDLATQQQGVENEQKAKTEQDTQKYRDVLLKEAQERLNNAHEEHLGNLELQQQAKKFAGEKALRDNYAAIKDAVNNAPPGKENEAAINIIKAIGGKVNGQGGPPISLNGQQLPGMPAQVTLPGAQEPMDISGLRSAAQVTQLKGENASAIQAPKSKVQLDLDAQKAQEVHQRDADKSTQGLANSLELQKARGATAVQLKDMADKTNMAIANAHNGTTLKHAQIMMGEDPNLSSQEAGIRAGNASSLYWGILDGTTKSKDLNKAQKMQVANFAHDIGSEVPSDSIGEISNVYAATGPIYKQAEDIINKYSADAPKGGRVAATLGGKGLVGNLTGYGKEIEGAQDQLQAQAARLAAQNDPKARLIGSVLASQTKGVFDPTRTKAQNLQQLENIKKANADTFTESTSGLPQDVTTALKARKGILGFEQTSSPTVNPSVVPPGGQPIMKPHPKNPNAIYNPQMSQQTGKDIWDLPATQSPTAVQPQNQQVIQ